MCPWRGFKVLFSLALCWPDVVHACGQGWPSTRFCEQLLVHSAFSLCVATLTAACAQAAIILVVGGCFTNKQISATIYAKPYYIQTNHDSYPEMEMHLSYPFVFLLQSLRPNHFICDKLQHEYVYKFFLFENVMLNMCMFICIYILLYIDM